MRAKNCRGNSMLEFVFVGIPLMFVLISVVEMARGMWIYHTLAYAVKEGTRYAIVHGQNSPTPASYQSVCAAIVNAGPGLMANQLSLTFTSLSGSVGPYMADSCPATQWPPGGGSTFDNQPGQVISIAADYPFLSAISMFWPGTKGVNFKNLTCQGAGTLCLPAGSRDTMQF